MSATRIAIVYLLLSATTLAAWGLALLPAEGVRWETFAGLLAVGAVTGMGVAMRVSRASALPAQEEKVSRDEAISSLAWGLTLALMAASVVWWRALAQWLFGS